MINSGMSKRTGNLTTTGKKNKKFINLIYWKIFN